MRLYSSLPLFSSLEAAFLLVSTKNSDLWEGPTPEVRDSRTSRHSTHAQSQVWQIWLAENIKRILCAYSENWTRPEVAILGADQKEHGLWEGECSSTYLPTCTFYLLVILTANFTFTIIMSSISIPAVGLIILLFFHLRNICCIKHSYWMNSHNYS